MDDPILRKATPDDSEFVFRTKKAVFREYVEEVWGWDEDEQRQLHERRFGEQDLRIIGHNGSDIGVVSLAVAPGCLKLNQLYLLPAHQGRGIGSKVMLLLMEEGRRLGLPIRLRVLKSNQRALSFYVRLGFKRTGETDSHIFVEGPL